MLQTLRGLNSYGARKVRDTKVLHLQTTFAPGGFCLSFDKKKILVPILLHPTKKLVVIGMREMFPSGDAQILGQVLRNTLGDKKPYRAYAIIYRCRCPNGADNSIVQKQYFQAIRSGRRVIVLKLVGACRITNGVITLCSGNADHTGNRNGPLVASVATGERGVTCIMNPIITNILDVIDLYSFCSLLNARKCVR